MYNQVLELESTMVPSSTFCTLKACSFEKMDFENGCKSTFTIAFSAADLKCFFSLTNFLASFNQK